MGRWLPGFAALVGLGVALLGCGSPPWVGKPNVLLLSIESLRWDHLGVAGYERAVSPNIDRLAARGTFFRRTYAQSSWTRPSVASTFSSTYQSTHGVYGDPQPVEGRLQDVKDTNRHAKLPVEAKTVAEVFGEAGYKCYGWSSNPQLWTELGFGQGFTEYRAVDVRDAEIVKKLTQLLENPPRRPFFVFAHFMATHLPYRPAEAHRPKLEEGMAITPENYQAVNRGEVVLTREDLDFNVALYDGAIQQIDAQIGSVLDLLEERSLTDTTVVVVMADHGEAFGEHGKVTHGHSVHEELIRVPLILAGPGVPSGQRVEALAQNIDILPTLARLVLDRNLESAQGRDLLALMSSEQSTSDPVFSELGLQKAVIEGPWKYISNGPDAPPELYNLDKDPYELRDLIEDPGLDGVRARLAGILQRFSVKNRDLSEGYTAAIVDDVPKGVTDRLKALGYVD